MSQYDRLIGEMNQQQVNAVLGVLQGRVGRDAAIGRADLVRAVRARGVVIHERQAREIIKSLRRLGHLICSAAGEDGGYYMAADSREFEAFVRAEYEGKIADMSETLSAMRKAARRQFGIATQGTLL